MFVFPNGQSHDHRWGLDCRWTSKLRDMTFGFTMKQQINDFITADKTLVNWLSSCSIIFTCQQDLRCLKLSTGWLQKEHYIFFQLRTMASLPGFVLHLNCFTLVWEQLQYTLKVSTLRCRWNHDVCKKQKQDTGSQIYTSSTHLHLETLLMSTIYRISDNVT